VRLGRVQRVDAPAPDVVVLTVYLPDEGKRILLFRSSGAAFAPARPKGEPADGFVRRMRKLLVGAQVHVERAGSVERLRFEAREPLFLYWESGEPVLRAANGKPAGGRRRLASREETREWAAAEAVPTLDGTPTVDVDDSLVRALRRDRKRRRRKLAKIQADGARAEAAPGLREDAALLLANATRWDGEADALVVQDWNGQTRMLPLRGSPAETADRLFTRAKKLERGARIARARAAEVEAELVELDELIDAAGAEADAAALRARALRLGVRGLGTQRSAERRRPTERKPYRRFLSDERPILVGRSAADNDTLTLRHARPHDRWLHVRSRRGAHVIVPSRKGEVLPESLLLDAATLAAHFSEAARDPQVDVQHTPRRHVHKRRGAAPGAVMVEREKVLHLRVEPDRVARLLASEVDA